MDDLAWDVDISVLPNDAWNLVLGTPDHRFIYQPREPPRTWTLKP